MINIISKLHDIEEVVFEVQQNKKSIEELCCKVEINHSLIY